MKYLLLILMIIFTAGCYHHSQNHGKGPYLKETVVDDVSFLHFYALFGLVDISDEKDIDSYVKLFPDCRVTTERTLLDTFLGILFVGLIDSRTVSVEFPVAKDSNRGREIIEREKQRQLRIQEFKLMEKNQQQ